MARLLNQFETRIQAIEAELGVAQSVPGTTDSKQRCQLYYKRRLRARRDTSGHHVPVGASCAGKLSESIWAGKHLLFRVASRGSAGSREHRAWQLSTRNEVVASRKQRLERDRGALAELEDRMTRIKAEMTE